LRAGFQKERKGKQVVEENSKQDEKNAREEKLWRKETLR